MIPRRVLHNPSISKSKIEPPKGPLPDWDSPSCYTGTVKRRPPSFEDGKILDFDIEEDDDDDDVFNDDIEIDCRGFDEKKSSKLKAPTNLRKAQQIFQPPVRKPGFTRPTTKKRVNQGLTLTEIYRDFPIKKQPPPYRNPPPPPPPSSTNSSPKIKPKKTDENLNKKIELENPYEKYYSLDIKDFPDKEDKIEGGNSNNYILFDPTNSTKKEMGVDENDILSKPEYSSNLFKNIPVRPRRGVPHMENYCLFDPSVDFINEKELKLKKSRDDLNTLNIAVDEDELIEEIIYADQMIRDPLVDDGNYFEIDPDYIEEEDEDESTIKPNLSTSSGSQPDSSNSDSMQNSVIESSPNPESTDESPQTDEKSKLPKSISGNIAGKSKTPSPTILKKSPQIDKLFRQSSLPTSTIHQKKVSLDLIAPKNISFKKGRKPESNYVLFNPGPVHSRIKYKVRQARPLSNYSDADSGFLSPMTPPEGPTELKFNPTVVVLEQCDSIQEYIEVSRFFNLY